MNWSVIDWSVDGPADVFSSSGLTRRCLQLELATSLGSTKIVDATSTCRGHDPARRVCRNTVDGPAIHGNHEGILHSVFRRRDVATPSNQRRNRLARDRLKNLSDLRARIGITF